MTRKATNTRVSTTSTENSLNRIYLKESQQGYVDTILKNQITFCYGPAGTSKIRIRGQSSFSGQNSPLIVINGVPIDNSVNNQITASVAADNRSQTTGRGGLRGSRSGLFFINRNDRRK